MSIIQGGVLTQRLKKTITFTGGAGAGATGQVTVATPTGLVLIRKLTVVCTSDLTSAGAPTLTLGTAGVVNALIALTTALNIDAGMYWASATPGTALLALPAGLKDFILATPLTMDVLIASITGGVLVFDIEWEGLNGGTLA